MGRNIDADKTPLLQNAEQNIGNSTVLQPQQGPATVIPQPSPFRLVDLRGGSAAGQTTSVIMTASKILPNTEDNPTGGLSGPVTGILHFGNGGRDTQVEFDIPIGPYVGGLSDSASPSQQPQDGGVIITVPTGVLRAYARYDNLLLAPVLGPNQSLAVLRGVSPVGPGGPRTYPITGLRVAEPVLVKGMAGYFSRHWAAAYKTLFCYVSRPQPLAPIVVGDPASNPALFDYFCLPAFAKKVQILRTPFTSALDVVIRDQCNLCDLFSVAANASSPTVNVVGHEAIIGIRSHTANDTVTFLAIVCEVGV